jgi:universal stress protein A
LQWQYYGRTSESRGSGKDHLRADAGNLKEAQDMTTDIPLNPTATGLSTAKEAAFGLDKEDALIYRGILVPVDFSEHSEKTVTYAAKLASRDDAKLTLLHVVQTPQYAAVPLRGTQLKLDEIRSHGSAVEQQAAANLAEIEGRLLQKGIKVESLLSKGRPFERIVEVAEAMGVDLIVIGSQGRSGLTRLARLVLGSTAERVVDFALCSVLVVKELHEQPD